MSKFRVNFNDGTFLENLTHEESQQIIEERAGEWVSVTTMEYATNLDPVNVQRRKSWKM